MGALRSPLLSACWAGVMGEERAGLSLGPGQLPPLALIEHSFPWDLEAASWGPFESGGLTAAVLGYPLDAKRNLNTLIKLSLKATASPGMLAHPTFSKFFINPHPGLGSRLFGSADIYASSLSDRAPPFPSGEPPTSRAHGSKVEIRPRLAHQRAELSWPL